MESTIFDGSSTTPCSPAQAKAAADQPGITWVDVRLQGGDESEATGILTAVAIDPAQAHAVLTAGLSTDFSITSTSVQGVCWIDDADGSPAVQVFFTWDQQRLVTVRSGGDAAIADIRQRIGERADLLRKDQSTLPGVVLQLMLATVQKGLTRMMIEVGSLDMEVIATQTPKDQQSQQLVAYRNSFAPLALRFPMYLVNVQAALIDPVTVDGLGGDGMDQLKQFLAGVQSTNGLIGNLADAVRNTAQDIQAQVSNWQGNRINVLTIVTMIFLPITFLTGYFGMNFAWLDDQLNSFWMWIGLGVALPIALVVGSVILLANGGYSLPRLLRRRTSKSG